MLGSQTIWLVFHLFVVLGLLLLLFNVVCAGIYDIKQASRKPKRRKTRLPSVTLLIPAYNEESVIRRCLDSVTKLKYPNFNIVVVDDASADATSKIIRQFKKEQPGSSIRLVTLRRNRGKGGALNYALRHYCDTDLLMVFDADCTAKADAVRRAVEYFNDRKVMGLASNIRVAEDPTLLSYLQKIEYLVGYRHKKYASLTNSEFIIGGQGCTYRTAIVKELGGFDEHMMTEDIALSLKVAKKGNKTHRLKYAADVITYTEAVPDLTGLYRQRYRWKFGAMQALSAHREMIFSSSRAHSPLLTWFRIPQALLGEILLLLEPFILGLFLLIAIASRSLAVFAGSWMMLTLYLLFVICVDEYLTLKERFKLSFLTPVMYPLFYTVTILNTIAMVKCVRNWRTLVGMEQVRGSWISPARVGKHSLN